MSNQLPVTFRASPLPYNWKGTPSQFLSALVSRLALDSQEQLALINAGASAPTSNVGPWLKNGVEWYVWSDIAGAYVPQTITALADLDPKPWRGNASAPIVLSYTIPASLASDLDLTEEYDPGSVFSGSTFTAPVNGIYHIDAKIGLTASTTDLVNNVIVFRLKKNGFAQSREQVFAFIETPTGGYSYSISTDLQLVAGDLITAEVGITVGTVTSPGDWTITQNDTWMSGFKIKSS